MKRAISRKLMAFLLFYTLWPTPVLAQESKAGVVTTLQGGATVARVAVPQETPLKFKDDVFYKDRISTKEDSIVRVLLGGKALITVRELSVLTITDEPGRAVVEMQSGKVLLAVARQRMRLGESVEIRTPNAIAAVRGTVMIVEVGEAPAETGPQPVVPLTKIHCLTGQCLYSHRGSHLQNLPLGLNESVDMRGAVAGSKYTTPSGIGQLFQPRLQTSNEGQDQAAQQGQDQAVFLANGALGSGGNIFGNGGGGGGWLFNPCPPSCPIIDGPPSKVMGTTNLISNGGFETGSLAPWVASTSEDFGGSAPSVISSLGPISPPQGSKMAKIVTDGMGGSSSISQSFTVASSLVITFKYKILTNEAVPSPDFNDGFFASLSGTTFFSKALTDLSFSSSEGDFGFETTGDFMTQTSVVSTSSGSKTLTFFVEDDAFGEPCGGGCDDEGLGGGGGVGATDTAVLIDDVQVLLDPPLLTVSDGARYVSTKREPLFSFSGETRTFDSLLLVCCAKDGQPSSVELAGPLMRATNSNLTVPFFLVGLYSGGFLTSSTTDPLVLVEGGSSSLGSMVGVFDVQGASTAVDPTTGLTLGTDRSLRTGGELFRADQAASLTSNRLLKVDTALLEASAPLLHLMNGSSMTSASSLMSIGPRANVIANVPSDALVKLNGSTLTVNQGSLVNVGGGSVLSVTGNLVSLTNGSTLNILNGSLVSISGGSVFRLTGGSLGAFGAGTNALSITNTAPLCVGCSLTTSVPNFGGYPVLLRNGAVASNVTVAPGFTPFAGLSGTNTVKVNGPSGAVLAVGGPTSKVILGP